MMPPCSRYLIPPCKTSSTTELSIKFCVTIWVKTMVPPTSRPSPNSTEPHSFPIRVYYEDTDAIGIVYHATYLNFAERARTEYLRSTGWNYAMLAKEFGLALVVRHIEISYHA